MPRRVNLPGASELFRTTQPDRPETTEQHPDLPVEERASAPLRPSGRVRHDEKITVYVSTEELLALEQVRIALRADQSMAVDRGRIVRAAIAAALHDYTEHGIDSELVRRLSES